MFILLVLSVLIFSCVGTGCSPTQQKMQPVLVPVSEDTYIQNKRIEAERQRDAYEYRATITEIYAEERSDIRRLQAQIERDRLRAEADRQRDLQRSRDRMREDWRDQTADARRDFRDMGRDIAPQVYKDVRRVLKRR